MKTKEKDEFVLSNKCLYLSPYSSATVLFEDELIKNNIKFAKYDSIRARDTVVYSFLKKDLEAATEIYDKIQQEEFRRKDLKKSKKKEKRKARRRTPEYRKKAIAVWIVVSEATFGRARKNAV